MLKKKIGFIGLGAMGFPMAKRLINSGFEVHVAKHSDKDLSIKKIDELKDIGAIVQEGFPNIAKNVDIIITILPADKEVKDVLLNKEFYDNVNKDAILLEMTSCTEDTMLEVGKRYLEKGVKVIDGPVSGGVSGAENGKLTVFASGDQELIDSISMILDVLASTVYKVGELGKGKALKSINQMMVAINMMSVLEGFLIAKEQGIDFDIMFDVIRESSGNSYAFERTFKNLVEEKYDPGFKLSLMRKDFKIALDSIGGIPLPFANLLYDIYLMGQKYDDYDYSKIIKLYTGDAEE